MSPIRIGDTREHVRIVDLAHPVTSTISDVEFEDVVVHGPAILALGEGGAFDGCAFPAPFDAVFREVPEGTVMVGVIGLQRVVFRRCQFENIGVVATHDLIQRFAEDMMTSEEPSP